MTLREENPEGFAILIVCAVFTLLATVGVALRFRSRMIMHQKLVLSDYSIIFALVLAYGNMVVMGLSVKTGMGRHLVDLTPEEIVRFVKCQVALSAIWIVTLTVVKVSILDLYIRIFQTPGFVKVVYCYMAIQIAWGIAGFLQIMLLCRPIQFNWDKTIKNGVCGSYEKAYFASHIIILILDFGTAILPIPVLWRLQMAPRKKIGITIMFAIGLVIGVFDLIRIAWRSKIDSPDFTESYAILFMFSLLEPELGIFLACLPLCQPVARAMVDSRFIVWSRNTLLHGSWSRSRTTNTTAKTDGLSGSSRITNQEEFRRLPGDNESSKGLRYEAHVMADMDTEDVGGERGTIHVKQTWNSGS